MKYLFPVVLGLALIPQQTIAQTCSCQETKGIEFEFAEIYEPLRKFGNVPWTTSPKKLTSRPYNEYLGKKGKFLGTSIPDPKGPFKFHEALLENCTKVYLQSIHDELDTANLVSKDIKIIDANTSWRRETSIDPMSDIKTCAVTTKSTMPFPMFFVRKGQDISVGVVGGDFPGKDVTFRVDKNEAISDVRFVKDQKAKTLLTQIRAGGRMLLVKAYRWPYDSPQLNEFKLDGLIEELDKFGDEVK